MTNNNESNLIMSIIGDTRLVDVEAALNIIEDAQFTDKEIEIIMEDEREAKRQHLNSFPKAPCIILCEILGVVLRSMPHNAYVGVDAESKMPVSQYIAESLGDHLRRGCMGKPLAWSANLASACGVCPNYELDIYAPQKLYIWLANEPA